MLLGVLPINVCIFYFIICLFIPESPRFEAYCSYRESLIFQDAKENAIQKQLPHVLWTHEDLQRKTVDNLLSELKKTKLLSVVGLILFEQFIGGISILFYMKKFAILTGSFIAICSCQYSLIEVFTPFSLHFIDRRWILTRDSHNHDWTSHRAEHPNL